MSLFDVLPIWAVFLSGICGLLFTAVLGAITRDQVDPRDQNRAGAPADNRIAYLIMEGTVALLAFMIAFTISVTVTQHVERKMAVVNEAVAIQKTWLQASFLNETETRELRKKLRYYTQMRVDAAAERLQVSEAIEISENTHREMWMVLEVAADKGDVNSDLFALLVESVNNVVGVHTKRITAVTKRLPPILSNLLVLAAVLCFFLIGFESRSGWRQLALPKILFAVLLASAMTVIVDLDRPRDGFLRVNQQPMYQLLEDIT